ncbi:GNAT family N-acetyltransferase [Solitalea koreensis]|uniref:Acetyltransferase (GNAT) domain-containing protein n=1 Tax=Solitalea koreensis TaxID=543615 RepID=A0A521CS83_9SPHI|nr:GNAT family N-acetyltransferase [Solitalea koreensis]SMO62245.1 Acetyltransferase (GNAT) domain-containing protein [Solitalea koreensis]
MNALTVHKDDFFITTETDHLDIPFIHYFLSKKSYWAANIPLTTVERSIQNSLCFGVFYKEKQVGFARVITDFSTFAYLADVFIIEEKRGLGLSKFLMGVICTHPDLQGLRRWVLATADAHKLYEQFGFTPLNKPERFMELHNPNLYMP